MLPGDREGFFLNWSNWTLLYKIQNLHFYVFLDSTGFSILSPLEPGGYEADAITVKPQRPTWIFVFTLKKFLDFLKGVKQS